MSNKLLPLSLTLFLLCGLLFQAISAVNAQQNTAIQNGNNPLTNNLYTPATSHAQYSPTAYKLFEADDLSEDELYFLMTFSAIAFFFGLLLVSSKSKSRVEILK